MSNHIARFEQALRSWTEAPDDGRNPPRFFATCKAEEGIVVISGWEVEEDHKAFRKQIMPHLHAAGVSRPASHEQLGIARFGWGSVWTDAP